MRFTCGCSVDAPGDYCDDHMLYSCHTLGCEPGVCDDPPCPVVEGECPPCRRNRWLSIGADRRATPTRAFRPSRETRSLDNG